jgi:PKD domain-containing protein
MRSTNLIAALSVTAALGLAATAEANTYCTGNPVACPNTSPHFGNVDGALAAAEGHAGHDVVLVASGTFLSDAGFEYWPADPANTVEIVGEGDATVLKSMSGTRSGTFRVLSLAGKAPTKVAKLKIVVPDAADIDSSPGGLELRDGASAQDVTVADGGNKALPAEYGIRVVEGEVRHANVTMNDDAVGIKVDQDGSALVVNSDVHAGHGVAAYQGGLATVRRSRITATKDGVLMQGGVMNVDSTLVRIEGHGGAGIKSSGSWPATTIVNASHVTLFGSSAADNTVGVKVTTPNDGDAFVKIDNSIVHNFETGLRRASTDAGGQGEATVQGHSVNYAAANDYSEGAGEFDLQNVTAFAPVFVDLANGDLRLKPTSPLIDKGRDASYAPLTALDLAGANRAVGAKRDLGAYEYQALAPVAAISGAGPVAVGKALALSGAGSHDADAGDAITSWKWTFGDGATGAGKTVSHAWTKAGTYQVALTVSDTTGRTHTAKATVVVSAPVQEPVKEAAATPTGGGGVGGATTDAAASGDGTDSGAAGGTSGGGGTAGAGSGGTSSGGLGGRQADTTAPAIAGLVRHGRAVRFSLSETATVRVRVERRSGRTLRALGAAKRIAGRAGKNSTRIGKLRAGRYRLVVIAIDAAGNRSVKRLAFRVVA